MPDFEMMYHIMCAAASEAIDALDGGDPAACRLLLQAALTEAEEVYINAGDNE